MRHLIVTFLLTMTWLCRLRAAIEPFDAFERKVYKSKKNRFATFDKEGTLTLDTSLNGKSNDITFPNNQNTEMRQETCMKNPKLVFEICQTEKLKAWTGVAICYESQLASPDIDPFFRIRPHSQMAALALTVCGKRQNAILINREVRNETAAAKYKPIYSVRTTFAPNMPLFFEMPDEQTDKQCVLLQLGGDNIFAVSMTNLRREPWPLYRNVDKQPYKTDDDFLTKFPDMNNRKHRLGDLVGPWLLLLDFQPRYNIVQNISAYGWLPAKIKITGEAIDPCVLSWKMLQSREVRGVQATEFKLAYSIATGMRGKRQSTRSAKKQGSESTGGSEQQKANLKLGVGISFQANWANTWGSQQAVSSQMSVTAENMDEKEMTRFETVVFQQLEGTINVEQLVYSCHGMEYRPDKLRYRDADGNPVLPPDAVEEEKAEMRAEADAQSDVQPLEVPSGMVCRDRNEECSAWASDGHCLTKQAFMFTRCRKSCRHCVDVEDNMNKRDPEPTAVQETTEGDPDCVDSPLFEDYCEAWHKDGECKKNPLFMSVKCRRTCGLCKTDANILLQQFDKLANRDGV